MDFKKVMKFLKRDDIKREQDIKKPQKQKTLSKRAFKAAFNNRFVDWLFTSRQTINHDLVTQLPTLIERSRDLSVNNEIFRSYLSNAEKTVVGAEGFKLQMQIKNADGSLDEVLNEEIEWAWYQFTHRGYLDVTQQLTDIDFDTLVLRNLLTDGDCFIQIIKDNQSQFGIRFKLIDSLELDNTKYQNMTEIQNGIYNGVEVDHNFRPVRYWLRKCYNGNYDSGQQYTIPAKDIIHLYKHEFINQVRGYSPVVASFDSLKQLDDYAVAELIAAKVASCQGVFYERNNDTPMGEFAEQDEIDDSGSFLQELAPGVASIVPRGYSIKTLQTNHPNADFNGFNKALVKRIGASIGTCYNRLNKDYSDVNYSSLKQANIDENNSIKSLQRFIIENWKNVEFELFLKNYLINNSLSKLRPSQYKKYIRSYRFMPKVDPYTDPAKEIIAVEKKLKLGITSPIAEIEKTGQDVQEVLKDWVKWNNLCKQNGLDFTPENQQHESFEDSNNLTEDE